jgi:protein-S-isoprenylcysteine O-methyltransferase Ste14
MSAQIQKSCPLHGLAVEREEAGGVLARAAVFVYGLLAYLAFFTVFLYAMGFVGRWFVPKDIDTGVVGPLWKAMAINAGLLMVFVVQHTIMARPAFKAWWTKLIPGAIERSTYVVAASAALALVFWQWRPMPGVVWEVEEPVAVWAISAVSLGGWGLVLAASFMVNHFDLFGLRQVWTRLMGRAYRPVGFRLVGLYKWVRHPLMLGFLIAFWATPVMTVGHLFFAVMTTAYIAFGVWIEERDLVTEHGVRYLAYRRAVPAIVPRVGGMARGAVVARGEA